MNGKPTSAHTRTIFLLMLLVSVPQFSQAAEPLAVLSGYSPKSWTSEDGLPIGPIWSIAQDEDGYIWLGSNAGLIRFDGVEFATAESLGYADLPSTPVLALLASRRGHSLIVGFGGGRGIAVVQKGLGRVRPRGRLPASVESLAEDSAGIVWAATDRGLYRYDGEKWTNVALTMPPVLERALTVMTSRRGSLWVGTPSGLFESTPSGPFRRFGLADEINSIAEDSQGQLWVTDSMSGFRRSDAARTPRAHQANGRTLLFDSKSNLWIGTAGQGLWRARRDGGNVLRLEAMTVETGLVNDAVTTVVEDRDQNIWVGTLQGLTRLAPDGIDSVIGPGLSRFIASAPEGGIWIGTTDGLFHLRNESSQPVRARGRAISSVTALWRDPRDNTVWVATDTAFAKLSQGRTKLVSLDPSTRLHQIISIAADSSDGLWLADGQQGLFNWDRTRLKRFTFPDDGEAYRVAFLYTDSQRRTWVGFKGGSLGTIGANGAFTSHSRDMKARLWDFRAITAIAEDAAGDIWIVGSGGLGRFADGYFAAISRNTGLPGDVPLAIAADSSGYMWLAVDGQILRFHRDEFAKAIAKPRYQILYRRFHTSNGVAPVYVQAGNAGMTQSDDGKLWFATSRGLAVIDTKALDAELSPGAVSVEVTRIIVDDQHRAPASIVSLPAAIKRIQLDYAAPQLTASSSVRFRYRLIGFDGDWIDAGTSRHAVYTNLPPRSYRFLVEAERDDRPSTRTQAAWDFTIRPMFYQTWWFYLICLTTLLVLLWQLWQLRVRHVRHEFALIVAERARVSREIHDTLLQNLAGVTIQCAGIANALDPSSPTKAQLIRVRHLLEGYLREVRQAVWDLRAPALETHDLESSLRAFGKQATADRNIQFDVTVRGKARRCPTRIENELLRIGQEAVTNAVQHSGARRIGVELRFDGKTVALRVTDDGRGFDTSYAVNDTRGHFGLLGMEERASRIGGHFTVDSRLNTGTHVEVVAPI